MWRSYLFDEPSVESQSQTTGNEDEDEEEEEEHVGDQKEFGWGSAGNGGARETAGIPVEAQVCLRSTKRRASDY